MDAWLDNGAYSHGFLAFAISLYIVWQRRFLIRLLGKIRPFPILILISLSILWWLAQIASVQKIEQMAVYLLLVMVVVVLGGWKSLRILLFPFLIILLVMPVWDFLQVPLQDLSTFVTYEALRMVDVPALLEGHQITVPGGRFLVEEACSGLGFILTALVLAVFYSYLNGLGWVQSCKLLLIAVTISIVANWIRIIAILLVGNFYGMDHPIVEDHLTFGWVVFSIALIPFFVISNRWFPAVASQNTEPEPLDSSPAMSSVIWLSIALIFMPVASFVHASLQDEMTVTGLVLPDQLESGIQLSVSEVANWHPAFEGADELSISKIEHQGHEAQILVVQYMDQKQGRELINVSNRLFSPRWNERGDEVWKLENGTGGSVRVVQLTSGLRSNRYIAYWYIVAGKATSSPIIAKMLEVYGFVLGNRRAVLVAVAADDLDSIDPLLEIAQPFYIWSVE